MLAVGAAADASSYIATRDSFEADSMLAVGATGASSYASKRENFESDAMLAVDASDASSYATKGYKGRYL